MQRLSPVEEMHAPYVIYRPIAVQEFCLVFNESKAQPAIFKNLPTSLQFLPLSWPPGATTVVQHVDLKSID